MPFRPAAIFVSASNDGEFHDLYNLTYGHHMDNGGMYGDVMEMLDEDYFRKHEKGELILPDRSYEIQLYAIMDCDAYDQMTTSAVLTQTWPRSRSM